MIYLIGASEPKNMAYMTRIGLWGKGSPFPEFNNFIQAVEKRFYELHLLYGLKYKWQLFYILYNSKYSKWIKIVFLGFIKFIVKIFR